MFVGHGIIILEIPRGMQETIDGVSSPEADHDGGDDDGGHLNSFKETLTLLNYA